MNLDKARPRIDPPKKPRPDTCPTCFKPQAFCLCADLPQIQSKQEILILQHPQEPDHLLGSARLAALSVAPAQLRVGLSWPNLTKALGKQVDPKKWGVLYLGSGAAGGKPLYPGVHFVDRKGNPIPPTLPQPRVDGWVIIDGTWSQAKTLWWRNPWLLKLHRAVLVPKRRSLYGNLRKEPRKECLSTLEAITETLELSNAISATDAEQLRALFGRLLDRARAQRGQPRTGASEKRELPETE
jgi:DTW domain-containing protein YfiP